MTSVLKNIEALIDAGGGISIDTLSPELCVAAASDGSNCLAMLRRRQGESLDKLLKRLDVAIALAWFDEIFTDEVNEPPRQSR